MNEPKNNAGRARRLLNGLMTDWVWEVCLVVIAAPVVINTFWSIGASVTA